MFETSLLDPIPCPRTKKKLAAELWSQGSIDTEVSAVTQPDLQPYWDYCTKECRRALDDGGRHVALRTYGDIVDCVHMIKDGKDRGDIAERFRERLTNYHSNQDEMLENSVNLAASLLTMISFCNYSFGFSNRSHLRWREKDLKSSIQAHFQAGVSRSAKGSVKFEKIFVARNLCRIAGLQIVWTDNLVDHLRLSDDDRRVHIFHHASFLELQKQSLETVLPEGLADETLRTIALLFPTDSARENKNWLAGLSSYHDIDKSLSQCGRLRTGHRKSDKFYFWRERLETLKQVFDEAQPDTLRQWWYDRRNGVQWYTFWVAVLVLVLTVVFGFVQCLEGAIQAYASIVTLRESSRGNSRT